MHRTRNAAYGQPYRGFESLPLRHSLSNLWFGLPSSPCDSRTAFRFLITSAAPLKDGPTGIAGQRRDDRGRLPLESRGPWRATAASWSGVGFGSAADGRECAG